MFNMPPTSLLGIDSSGLSSTPKTPEIVNSLIAMSNPLDSYNFGVINSSNASTPGSGVCGRTFNGAHMQFSQDSSHSSSSTSPLDSPAGTNTTPSVQQIDARSAAKAMHERNVVAAAAAVAAFEYGLLFLWFNYENMIECNQSQMSGTKEECF